MLFFSFAFCFFIAFFFHCFSITACDTSIEVRTRIPTFPMACFLLCLVVSGQLPRFQGLLRPTLGGLFRLLEVVLLLVSARCSDMYMLRNLGLRDSQHPQNTSCDTCRLEPSSVTSQWAYSELRWTGLYCWVLCFN